MDRIAAGIAIALAALAFSGGPRSDALAGEPATPAPAAIPVLQVLPPVVNGSRSERVLGLILALEALRATPVLLDTRKS